MSDFDFDLVNSSEKADDVFSHGFDQVQNTGCELNSSKKTIPEISCADDQNKKMSSLCEVLKILSELDARIDDSVIAGICDFFTTLYQCESEPEFRHMYSDVCKLMYSHLNVDNPRSLDNGVPGKNWILQSNVRIIKSRLLADDGCPKEVAGGITKLYDHVALENQRMSYMGIQNRALKANTEMLRSEFEKQVSKKVEEASDSFLKTAEEERKKLQREHIAVLGIFAAVVVAFMSGTSFSSSVLQNIDKVGIFRLTFVILLVGLFMFLMISSLFVFLNRVSSIDNEKMVSVVKCGSVVFVALMAMVVLAKVASVSDWHLPGFDSFLMSVWTLVCVFL